MKLEDAVENIDLLQHSSPLKLNVDVVSNIYGHSVDENAAVKCQSSENLDSGTGIQLDPRICNNLATNHEIISFETTHNFLQSPLLLHGADMEASKLVTNSAPVITQVNIEDINSQSCFIAAGKVQPSAINVSQDVDGVGLVKVDRCDSQMTREVLQLPQMVDLEQEQVYDVLDGDDEVVSVYDTDGLSCDLCSQTFKNVSCINSLITFIIINIYKMCTSSWHPSVHN